MEGKMWKDYFGKWAPAAGSAGRRIKVSVSGDERIKNRDECQLHLKPKFKCAGIEWGMLGSIMEFVKKSLEKSSAANGV